MMRRWPSGSDLCVYKENVAGRAGRSIVLVSSLDLKILFSSNTFLLHYIHISTLFPPTSSTSREMCFLEIPVYHVCRCRGESKFLICESPRSCGHNRKDKRPEEGGPWIQEITQNTYCPNHPGPPSVPWPAGVAPLPK